MGFKQAVRGERIADYTTYFFEHQLVPHFRLEEKEIFSCLPEQDPLRKEAEAQHKELYNMASRLAVAGDDREELVNSFEQALEKHIRFEERQLFMHIQEQLDEQELEELRKRVEAIHAEEPEHWEDRFWE